MLSSSKYKKNIGKNGYTFIKEEIGDTHLKQITKDLTVFPKVCQNYAVENEPVEPEICPLALMFVVFKVAVDGLNERSRVVGS